MADGFAGSSPRMRGTQKPVPVPVVAIRIIPADAENTSFDGEGIGFIGDHPRGCGEHLIAFGLPPDSWGSSPRMRGTPPDAHDPAPAGRIIPADAGNTRTRVPSLLSRWDHPRGCGEHAALSRWRVGSPGSSPRMRGTLRIWLRRVDQPRIIPADAGNTTGLGPWHCMSWDHPRGCGEHGHLALAQSSKQGSSPRMRGTLRGDIAGCCADRIIPADAGNTCGKDIESCPSGDHPRGCGEHSFLAGGLMLGAGSSPRMRGTRGVDVAGPLPDRIIPADAGNTL